MSRLRTLLRKFSKDTKGVSALEFALIAPILIILYLGTAELTMALTADRKVTGAANTVADLIAQDDFVSDTELSDILSAGDAIIYPETSSNLALRISSVRMDIDGDVFIDWSEGRGLTALSADDVPELPDGLLAPMNSIIMVEAQYPFYGPFPSDSGPLMTLSDTAYLRPRRSAWVRREG